MNNGKKVAPSDEHSEPQKEDCADASATNNHREDNNSAGDDNQGESTNNDREFTREELEKNIALWTGLIQSNNILLKAAKERKKSAGKDKQKKEQAEADIEKLEAKIKDYEELVKSAREILRSLPPEVLPDEEQPWYGKLYANGSGYYLDNGVGGWTYISEKNAERELRAMGISHRPDTETTSPLDRALLSIQKRHKVDYAGPLAGYNSGMLDRNGMKVLVTRTTKLIEPKAGEFPTINAILNGLLRDKRKYFDAYSKLTYDGLEVCITTGKSNYGPVIVLAGPKNCGKSLVQEHIITPLLGGRSENPYQYMVGETSFNSELAAAGHLMLEDESAAKDIATRRRLGSYIKKYAANKKNKSHGKGKEGITLSPYSRLSVSVNDEPEHLEVLPPIDETISDKILLLKCFPFKLPMPASTPSEKMAFEAVIARELPAYLYWLKHEFKISTDIEGGRYGFQVFQDPEIMEAIEGTSSETQLLEILKRQYFTEGELYEDANVSSFVGRVKPLREPHWVNLGTATQVFSALTDHNHIEVFGKNAARKLLASGRTCGNYLSRLDTKHPELIKQYRGHGGKYKYRIYCDPKEYLKEMSDEEGSL